MNHKRTITALAAALMLSAALPAGAQSVPVIDDNSGAIKTNTNNISNYLKDIRQFLGADQRDKTVKGSGLETDVADFKKIESQAKQLTSGQWSNGDEEKFRKAIETYYGKDAATSSMCNKEGGKSMVKGTKSDEENMQKACNNARNLIALNLYEIHRLAEVLEERNEALQKLVKKWDYGTSGELQKKQYQLALMQTLIQNDLSRLQASLAAYQTKINLYRQIQAESERNILYGKQTDSASAKLTRLAQGAGGIAAAATTIVALEKSNSLVEKLVGGVGKGIDSAKKEIRRALQ
ncbi:hypothetical protein ACI43T_09485 [Neisseria oralis]|uniref:Uncharacterized protein n=1 Tax=Neisseria oralis TaxID=1107316 RepID=A0ABW8Q555_9NEIS